MARNCVNGVLWPVIGTVLMRFCLIINALFCCVIFAGLVRDCASSARYGVFFRYCALVPGSYMVVGRYSKYKRVTEVLFARY